MKYLLTLTSIFFGRKSQVNMDLKKQVFVTSKIQLKQSHISRICNGLTVFSLMEFSC
ncbi:uncharacterized protein METZ01_LOCUS339310 [marine metagenome]|uniref:Uncharacterized protein n=1 Tax=marine metagenome TaxID=408172 RepID=A0A382QLY7_9ZZZZ